MSGHQCGTFLSAKDAKCSYTVKNLQFRVAESEAKTSKESSKSIVIESKKNNSEVKINGSVQIPPKKSKKAS